MKGIHNVRHEEVDKMMCLPSDDCYPECQIARFQPHSKNDVNMCLQEQEQSWKE